jgi:HEAT repeat protein
METGDGLTRAEKLAQLEGGRALFAVPRELEARLSELLQDPDEDVRGEAISCALGASCKPALVERALELSRLDPSPAVRVRATAALGRLVNEGDMAGAAEPGYEPDLDLGEPSRELFVRVRDHLLALVRDGTRQGRERWAALESLGALGSERVVQELIEKSFAANEKGARLAALAAMGKSGNTAFERSVLGALHSEDDATRERAIVATGEIGLASAVPELVRRSREGSKAEQLLAVVALGHVGGPAATQALLEVSERGADPELRGSAARALEELAADEL